MSIIIKVKVCVAIYPIHTIRIPIRQYTIAEKCCQHFGEYSNIRKEPYYLMHCLKLSQAYSTVQTQ